MDSMECLCGDRTLFALPFKEDLMGWSALQDPMDQKSETWDSDITHELTASSLPSTAGEDSGWTCTEQMKKEGTETANILCEDEPTGRVSLQVDIPQQVGQRFLSWGCRHPWRVLFLVLLITLGVGGLQLWAERSGLKLHPVWRCAVRGFRTTCTWVSHALSSVHRLLRISQSLLSFQQQFSHHSDQQVPAVPWRITLQ